MLITRRITHQGELTQRQISLAQHLWPIFMCFRFMLFLKLFNDEDVTL